MTIQTVHDMRRSPSLLFVGLLFTLSFSVSPADAQLQEGHTYRLQPVTNAALNLFPENASLDASTPIVLWEQTDVPAEQWEVGRLGFHYTFQNTYTRYFLSVSNNSVGSTTRQARNASTARWQLEVVDEAALIYRLIPAAGSACLQASASGVQPTLAKVVADNQQQLWQFVEVEPQAVFDSVMQRAMIDLYLDRFLQKIDSRRATFIRGSWGESEQLEVLLDAYEATRDDKYLSDAIHVYNFFNANVGSNWLRLVYSDNYKWYGHDFNDDVMWQIIATARLGWLTGQEKYTKAARQNFDAIWDRAYIPFTGLMRWAEQSGDPYGTNSCIAGPTEVAACYLAMSGAGEKYYEKARDLYAAQRYRLTNMNTGQVYDACVWNPETQKVKSLNDWASTYNQGTFLGAATMLYLHYGDEQYLADAQKVMEYTVKNLCNRQGIINACQVNDGDLCGFKGILMRYVRRFVTEAGQTQYQEWLAKNAFHAYNNRSPQGVTTSSWLKKSTNDVATNAFSCSCAASVAAAVVFSKEETGIQPVPDEGYRIGRQTSSPLQCYDLSGRPTPLTHGTLILGRRKVMIR